MARRRKTRVRVRRAELADVPALATLETEVWAEAAATEEMLEARISNCPEGNLIAVTEDGRFCGQTCFCFLDYDDYEARGQCSWYDLSGNGTASTNVPGAPDLFGINLVATKWAPKGASLELLAGVVRAGIRARARRGILGARMPRYHRYADKMTPEEYFRAERRPGVPLDPELRYYYDFGMRPVRLVEDYFDDPESLNWGVLVEMSVPAAIRLVGPLVAALPIDLVGLLEKVG